MNRDGKTFRHKHSGAVVLVVQSRSMSQSTTRHTLLVLDGADGRHQSGAQVHVDDVPIERWDRIWEEA